MGVDAKEDVLGRFWIEKFHKVPYPEEEGYLEDILDICQKESVEVVLPQTTRETEFLSRHKEEFRRQDVSVMVSDRSAVEIANNKWRLLQAFEKLELPYPVYFLVRSEKELLRSVSKLGYPERPVVVKPPISNGMRGYRELREGAWNVQRFLSEKPNSVEISLNDLISVLNRDGDAWPELLVTEHLPGPEYSVDAFAGSNVSVAIPRLRKSIVNGISFESVIELRNDMIDYTIRAAREIGLKYAFGFQFKLDEKGVPRVLECNPRVQGTMVASVFSGVNVIWLALREALGQPPLELPALRNSGLFHRFWGGVAVQDNKIIREI